jgi:hypothetical protein
LSSLFTAYFYSFGSRHLRQAHDAARVVKKELLDLPITVAQFAAEILFRTAHGAGGTHQVAPVGRPGGQILVDHNPLVANRVFAWTLPCPADRIAYDKCPIESATFEVIAEGDKWHMDAVGDEAEHQTVGKTECPLNNVVVPRQRAGTTVSQMSEKRQAGVDRRTKFVKRRIAMAGRNSNTLPCQVFRNARVCISFGRERDNLREPAGGFKKSLHRIDVGRLGSCGRVRANVARLLVEERTFDMDAPDHCRSRWIGLASSADVFQTAAHGAQFCRDDGRQNAGDSLAPKSLANSGHALGRERVGIEIDICVSIHLQVDIAALSIHNH